MILREREFVTSHFTQVGDLPAWVQFPDVERIEWINKVKMYDPPHFNILLVNLRLSNSSCLTLANIQMFFSVNILNHLNQRFVLKCLRLSNHLNSSRSSRVVKFISIVQSGIDFLVRIFWLDISFREGSKYIHITWDEMTTSQICLYIWHFFCLRINWQPYE
jgi:hypothetical protein